jgi:hypothetical protein
MQQVAHRGVIYAAVPLMSGDGLVRESARRKFSVKNSELFLNFYFSSFFKQIFNFSLLLLLIHHLFPLMHDLVLFQVLLLLELLAAGLALVQLALTVQVLVSVEVAGGGEALGAEGAPEQLLALHHAPLVLPRPHLPLDCCRHHWSGIVEGLEVRKVQARHLVECLLRLWQLHHLERERTRLHHHLGLARCRRGLALVLLGPEVASQVGAAGEVQAAHHAIVLVVLLQLLHHQVQVQVVHVHHALDGAQRGVAAAVEVVRGEVAERQVEVAEVEVVHFWDILLGFGLVWFFGSC